MSLFDHHAYLVSGGKEAVPVVLDHLAISGFSTNANPDFNMEHYSNLGINEARTIKENDLRNPIGERKVFVISYESITREAQNALLKTFEEPSGNSYYFLCINKEDELLPTLRSRLIRYDVEVPDKKREGEAVEFLKMELDERMVFCHEFAEEIKKEKKNKKDVEEFLNQLEETLFHKKQHIPSEKLSSFLEIKNYIFIKGSSAKNILETVSIILPVL